jgi:hypothetical protein
MLPWPSSEVSKEQELTADFAENADLLATEVAENTARPSAATKLLNYGIRGKRGKGYRRIEEFVKNAMPVRC